MLKPGLVAPVARVTANLYVQAAGEQPTLKPETGQLSVTGSVVLLVMGLAVVRVARAIRRAVGLNCMMFIVSWLVVSIGYV